ncbi:phage tail protein [Sphingomonas sp. TREG-RG-20F-R18-01]|uniref:phage tail protein n=1 Tax=Sphingomonas sp. TREG-RG-20F-R18-01 TaxID=2914982 RepID=UPI001F573A57|nr:phage tail protein [Sphingomonas sp. TREG-RG-20F-R18-01]
MATLVLTVAGTVIGGPIGGAIGAALGSVIDHDLLFAPKGREGPRLSTLQGQTSSYGTPIQRIYGTMRVGGCVIWSTELIESTTRSSSGKGQPSLTAYSYSVSFAVALSGRPILDVGRIWADGKLLRGADGAFKSATGFRLHRGDEDQAIDPLLAAAEGGGLSPAHRGVAYAVFEQLQLADYGNRIPSLTFEVIADAGPVSIGAIVADPSDDGIVGDGAAGTVTGFAAYGDSVRSAIEPLAEASGTWFAPAPGLTDARLVQRGGTVADRVIDLGETIADGATPGAAGRSIAALETVARQVVVSYYDPARDFQVGVQRARRPGAGAREDRVALAAAVDAGSAKTIAEQILAQGEAGREQRTVTLGWDALDILPGTCVTIRDVAGVWHVTHWAFEQHVVTLVCVRLAARTAAARASPGRLLPAPDVATGQTLLVVAEMLPFDDVLLAAPRLTIIAAGTAPGWRRAAILYSVDDGARWVNAGATAAPGVIGRIVAMSSGGSAALVDHARWIEVDLAHAEMTLAGADPAALAAGANVALAGKEMLQFGVADQVGMTRWKLSGLLRGRRGTEDAIGTQAPGDPFAVLTPESATTLDLTLATLGSPVRLLATGPGDLAGPASAVLTPDGASIVPPSPVQLDLREIGNGDVAVQWVRRSRTGWQWTDGVDAPLGEEREAYRVTIGDEAGVFRSVSVTSPTLLLLAAERANGTVVAVRQVGTHGESRPARLAVPAWIT